MAPVARKTQFHMLLSNDEDTMLRWLADADGLTASDYLRTTIRREYASRQRERNLERVPPRPLKPLK